MIKIFSKKFNRVLFLVEFEGEKSRAIGSVDTSTPIFTLDEIEICKTKPLRVLRAVLNTKSVFQDSSVLD